LTIHTTISEVYQTGSPTVATYTQGTVVGGWKCGPGATNPILAKHLPGTCSG